MPIEAVRHVKKMWGRSQSHLVAGSDCLLYVVKFTNNAQHVRVLANEMVATSLAAAIGLAVPSYEIVHVSKAMVAASPEMTIETRFGTERAAPGRHFGSRMVGVGEGGALDSLASSDLLRTSNLGEFLGALAFDKWTGNEDDRQAVWDARRRDRRHRNVFIDFGHSFGAAKWRPSDLARHGVFPNREVYRRARGWEDFEPWLGRIENFSEKLLWSILGLVPPEWYANDRKALAALGETLLARRASVRDRILAFARSGARPFPAWEGLEREARPASIGSGARLSELVSGLVFSRR